MFFRKLTAHVSVTRHITDVSKVYCNYCGKSYKSRPAVYNHIRLEHQDALLAYSEEIATQNISENVTMQNKGEKEKPKEATDQRRDIEEPS
jgi:hypothetical protein